MPGGNCSIYGCPVSRRSEYRGISLFKVPVGKNDYDKTWREKLIAVITKDREINASLRSQIENSQLFICQKHFTSDQYFDHGSRVTLNPGAIPTMNLPQKSHPSSVSTTKCRDSTISLQQKRESYVLSEIKVKTAYKSYEDFKSRVASLKLNGWQTSSHENYMSFFYYDQIHSVPKYEIYVDECLSYSLRCLLWSIPKKHELYHMFNNSVENTTIYNLCSLLSSSKLCPGLTENFSGTCIEHIVPHIFTCNKTSFNSSPLFQTKWYRPVDCLVLVSKEVDKCSECAAAEKRENISLKRKQINMSIPAKTKAPITLTSPERMKLTVQELRSENKFLHSELEKIQSELQSNSLKVNDELNND